MTDEKIYIAIDLKSFYASVECVLNGFDPLNTNLVVADASRTEKTICLAVSPTLKAYGISGRARLFEVVSKMKQVNNARLRKLKGKEFTGKSIFASELAKNDFLMADYFIATPRMAEYVRFSTIIYRIYLKYVAPEDIHVYSIDEVFIDATSYLATYKMTPEEFTMKLILEVLDTTKITATAGIGSNMYLCKIAMDIVAKHVAADKNGVRIARLDEMSYRKLMWEHTPLTDFWRVGKGTANKLSHYGIHTMGDIARCSIANEELLYKLFGINAELLIDHAWGYEPCTMEYIKQYKPENNSFSTGQVLTEPYTFEKAKVVAHEMCEEAALDLVDKGMVTNQIVLYVGYDIECLSNSDIRHKYFGDIVTDHYGRKVPKPAHGSTNLSRYTSSARLITAATLKLFDDIVNKDLLVRRLSITTNHVKYETDIPEEPEEYTQLDLFTDFDKSIELKQNEEIDIQKDRKLQEAMLSIKKKYGKNSIVKGINYEEGATGIARNSQIGGHKA